MRLLELVLHCKQLRQAAQQEAETDGCSLLLLMLMLMLMLMLAVGVQHLCSSGSYEQCSAAGQLAWHAELLCCDL
jgi:hypothetical protein